MMISINTSSIWQTIIYSLVDHNNIHPNDWHEQLSWYPVSMGAKPISTWE